MSDESKGARRRVRGSKRFRPALTPLEARALLATITVTSPTDAGAGSLRQAVATAAPGDTINFASSLDGKSITLTSGPIAITQDLTIQGPGAGQLTVDGGGKQGIFTVQPATLAAASAPPVVAIDGMTIADAMTIGNGGGVDATQADLTLDDDSFVNDQAGEGGAVYVETGVYNPGTVSSVIVTGSLSIGGSSFQYDQATSSGGGALGLVSVPTTISGSTFSGDTADFGGAIDVTGGAPAVIDPVELNSPPEPLTVTGSMFAADRAVSNNDAQGGAIYVTLFGAATVTGSVFYANQAIGGVASELYTSGGAIYADFGSNLAVTGSEFVDNQAIATGEAGSFSADAQGGALAEPYDGLLTVSGCGFALNSAQGGTRAAGGAISKSDLYSASDVSPAIGLTISASGFLDNLAQGGNALGGAVFNGASLLNISGSLFQGNQAAAGPFKGASGGAVEDESSLTLTGSGFGSNLALGGSGGDASDGWGGSAGGSALSRDIDEPGRAPTQDTISDSTFAANWAVGGADIGASAEGGSAAGGGLSIDDYGTEALTKVVMVYNWAIGGAGGPVPPDPSVPGGPEGEAAGGGLALGGGATFTITGGSFIGNLAKGGDSPAGAAGNATGGAINAAIGPESVTLSGTSLLSNLALGGDGTSGGDGEGGGIYVPEGDGIYASEFVVVSVANSTITGNHARGGSAGRGFGGGAYIASGGTLTVDSSTTLSGNTASTGGDDRYDA